MTHVRKQIRDAVAVKLTGLTATGNNVFKNRTQAITENILPCLIISTESDDSEFISMGYPRLENRRLTVAIRALAQASSAIDDVLDDICLSVEQALSADISLAGLAKDLQINATNIQFNSESETNYGEATMLWTATYYIQETAPETAI